MAKFVGKYVRDKVLGWFSNTAFPAVPTNFYLALYTAAPTAIDGTGGTETSYTGYARQAIAPASGWSAISTNGSGLSALEQISNAAAVTFPNNTGSAVTIVGWGLFDALTSGNFLAYGDLQNSVIVGSTGMTVSIGNLLNQM